MDFRCRVRGSAHEEKRFSCETDHFIGALRLSISGTRHLISKVIKYHHRLSRYNFLLVVITPFVGYRLESLYKQ